LPATLSLENRPRNREYIPPRHIYYASLRSYTQAHPEEERPFSEGEPKQQSWWQLLVRGRVKVKDRRNTVEDPAPSGSMPAKPPSYDHRTQPRTCHRRPEKRPRRLRPDPIRARTPPTRRALRSRPGGGSSSADNSSRIRVRVAQPAGESA
jgi:hypothetical protein